MTRLALLRHGHTDWNRAGRIQGRTDILLDPEARAQLMQRQLPEAWQNAQIVSSPLARARETAELVTRRTPVLVPALIEMNWGQWEGLRGADLIADPASGYRHIEDWGWDFCPPEGESPRDVLNRLLPWAQTVEAPTVAVCHIGIMRVLLAHAAGWDFTGTPPFRIKRDRLYVLHLAQENWTVEDTPIRLQERDA